MRRPIDGFDYEERAEQQRVRRNTMFTSMKMDYLDRLSALLDSGGLPSDSRATVIHRVHRVCDSIESDLNRLEGGSH
ncbi:hypothetical protein B9T62_15720 [Paenibacillus donghaensis]|uniref:Uncharacterized protein n=1 Tax=Paenibacillus donghaensis TaxID=414771 RepID=A0A2Z2KSH0_9BACL|nr:hypothetical protein B9T62_15720 [Paenibacillus donghaensis]